MGVYCPPVLSVPIEKKSGFIYRQKQWAVFRQREVSLFISARPQTEQRRVLFFYGKQIGLRYAEAAQFAGPALSDAEFNISAYSFQRCYFVQHAVA
jgi:hypothetical protein